MCSSDLLSGPIAIGVVMKETLKRFGSAADGATVNRIDEPTTVIETIRRFYTPLLERLAA